MPNKLLPFATVILILFLLTYDTRCSSNPTFTVYSPKIMFSGQYNAIASTQAADTSFNHTQQPIYRNTVDSADYFTTLPTVMLSMMGYSQTAPSTADTFVGFDCEIVAIRLTEFDIQHNIFGADVYYLHYMYLAMVTDLYTMGYYTQSFDMTQANKTYSIDVLTNETYSTYPTNTIEMKGFLGGYKIKQGTADGFYLNFSITVKNGSAFTIDVSTHTGSELEKIVYFRIGYDRTAIERDTYKDVFYDFAFQLQNNANTKSVLNQGWNSQTQFQYRNFLMGTNKININGSTPMAIEFYLYYYYASGVANVAANFNDNPATAQYLYGQSFYHVFQSCPGSDTPTDIYYLPTDKLCYDACPSTGFFTDTSASTCVACHYSCNTCSAGHSQTSCIDCDTSKRTFESSNGTCLCASDKYDDGVSMTCGTCDVTCQTCSKAGSAGCTACDTAGNREFSDANSDGVGECLCKSGYYQDSSNVCQACTTEGCLACTVSSSVETCTACNTSAQFESTPATSTSCACQSSYQYVSSSGTCELASTACGDGIIDSSTEQCDDNNTANTDGCSSQCKVEANHVCILNSSESAYSICYFNSTIGMSITEVKKSPYSNEVSLSLQISAEDGINDEFLQSYLTEGSSILLQDNVRRRLLQGVTLAITIIYFDLSTRVLYVSFTYDQTFDITTKKITFQPSSSVSSSSTRYFYSSPTATVSLQSTFNKIDTIYYDSSEYDRAIMMKWVFMAFLCLFWMVSVGFIIIGKGSIAMETMLLYILGYVSLLSQSSLEITFGGYSQFGKYSIGYNIDFFYNFVQCPNFLSLELSCALINNINLTFGLMILLVIALLSMTIYNKVQNYRARQLFLEQQQRKAIECGIQFKTDANLKNAEEQNEQQSSGSESYSSSQNTDNPKYYEDRDFVSPVIRNVVLDCLYYFAFITVPIFGMSMCFIKEQAVASVLIAVGMVLVYLYVWVYWFVNYKGSDFSFVDTHRSSESFYEEDVYGNNSSSASQSENYNRPDQQRVAREAQKRQKSRCSPNFLKILFYPFIWLALLGCSISLALSQPVGYISQSLIIGGCVLFGALIWFTKIYKEKLHVFRAILNCLLICLIEVVYIVSQTDEAIGSGIAISGVTVALLGLGIVNNLVTTLYLFKIERKLSKKQQQQRQVDMVQMEIDNRLKMEEAKKRKTAYKKGPSVARLRLDEANLDKLQEEMDQNYNTLGMKKSEESLHRQEKNVLNAGSGLRQEGVNPTNVYESPSRNVNNSIKKQIDSMIQNRRLSYPHNSNTRVSGVKRSKIFNEPDQVSTPENVKVSGDLSARVNHLNSRFTHVYKEPHEEGGSRAELAMEGIEKNHIELGVEEEDFE